MKYLVALLTVLLFCSCAIEPKARVGTTEQQHDDEVFEVSQFDKSPEMVKLVMPIYPSELLVNNIQGDVELFIVISEKGDVIEAKVGKAEHELFVESALRAIYRCKYTPPILNGKPVKARFRVVIPFRL